MSSLDTIIGERDRLAEYARFVIKASKDGTLSEGDCLVKALDLELVQEDIVTEEDALDIWYMEPGGSCFRTSPWLESIESVSGDD
jgi:hypothetical protein